LCDLAHFPRRPFLPCVMGCQFEELDKPNARAVVDGLVPIERRLAACPRRIVLSGKASLVHFLSN
jgi:hypothetical protein